MQYQKHFVPLESDPEIFTVLMHELGVSDVLQFVDVWSTQDEEQLALIPRPVLAVIVIFPDRNVPDAPVPRFGKAEPSQDSTTGALWFKQTIHNACGLYALLHAVCNSVTADFIQPDSVLQKIIDSCQPLNPPDRAKLIADSDEIEQVYANAALKGTTQAPAATDEIECHYVCFTKASDHALLLLDGDRDGPLESTETLRAGEDILQDIGLKLIQSFIQDNARESISNVGLMALVQK